MALYKLSKSKTFHIDYCGCTAATSLLNELMIRDAIDFIRQTKTKRDIVRTVITVSKDGLKITYNNEPKFTTIVPSTMIAGSANGKTTSHNFIGMLLKLRWRIKKRKEQILRDNFIFILGVVYISPSTTHHYPAFIHIYRCDTPHIAQKFLSRLRSYLLIESHRLRIVQLEEQLFKQDLLNRDHFHGRKSRKSNVENSSPEPNHHIRQENRIDPIKSITEELQKKIHSNEPILFPPKDYDTIHAAHGNIQRAQAWKSTEVKIYIRLAPVLLFWRLSHLRRSINNSLNVLSAVWHYIKKNPCWCQYIYIEREEKKK